MSPIRNPTETGQIAESLDAKRKRDASTPVYVCEDVTSRYEGVELEEHRAKRPTDERIARLEKKNDDLVKQITEMAGLKFSQTIEGNAAAVKDAIDGNKSRRELVKSIVLGVLALVNALLIGKAVL